MIARLRAALTPWALVILAAILLLVGLFSGNAQESEQTALEERISRTLSAMEGAGDVRVVISMRETVPKSGALSYQNQQTQVPSGAVAVAQGADDPFVCAQLTQALCALLGLPASAVSVISGGR